MKKDNVKVSYPKSYFDEVRNNKRQRIYDCFSFFNELDLLELRLNELDANVDYFVITEANKTFSGDSKELYFKKNKERFKKWSNKIIHIIVDMPSLNFIDRFLIWLEKILPRKIQLILRKILFNVVGGVARYKLVEFQKRSVIGGLNNCNENDIIMGIDLDEIPNPKKINEAKRALEKYLFVEFEMDNFRYYLNGKIPGVKSPGTRACKFKTLKSKLDRKIDFLRTAPYLWRRFKKDFQKKNYFLIRRGGWHFSYLGGIRKVIEKLKTRSHPEYDKKEIQDEKKVKKMIEEGYFPVDNLRIDYITIDKSFPLSIRRNLKKFKEYIK